MEFSLKIIVFFFCFVFCDLKVQRYWIQQAFLYIPIQKHIKHKFIFKKTLAFVCNNMNIQSTHITHVWPFVFAILLVTYFITTKRAKFKWKSQSTLDFALEIRTRSTKHDPVSTRLSFHFIINKYQLIRTGNRLRHPYTADDLIIARRNLNEDIPQVCSSSRLHFPRLSQLRSSPPPAGPQTKKLIH